MKQQRRRVRTAALLSILATLTVLPSTVSFGSTQDDTAVRPAPPGFEDITRSAEGQSHASALAHESSQPNSRIHRRGVTPDDFQVFRRTDGDKEIIVSATRELQVTSVEEVEEHDGTQGLRTTAIITSQQFDEAMHRREHAAERRPASSASATSHTRSGTGTWTDLGCAILNSQVRHQLNTGEWKIMVVKNGCGHIDKSNTTDSDGRYHYAVHFRQESDAHRYDEPYHVYDDWARLDAMLVKVQPYNMNFLWSGTSKKPGTRSPISGSCSNYNLSISTLLVSAGTTVPLCEYWYPYWNDGSDFYYMQNEWRAESEQAREVGVTFVVKRGGTNGGTFSFAFTNAVYYDLWDNGFQVCNDCKK